MCELKIGTDLLDQYISPFPWELMEKTTHLPQWANCPFARFISDGELLGIQGITNVTWVKIVN